MLAECSPYLGGNATGSGAGCQLPCPAVTRESKNKKLPNQLRYVLGRRVRELRDQRYLKQPTATARNEVLARAAGCSVSQVERIISGELGTSVDYIEALAKALDVEPFELLQVSAEQQGAVPEGATARSLQRSSN